MANPQADKYTKISNELLEALAKIRIAGEARQMLDVIIRKTYGFNKKEDKISTSQFMYLTGLSNRAVHKGRKRLLNLNIITIHKKGYGQVLTYCIQKDYHRWQPYPKKGIPKKGDTQKGPELYPKKGPKCPPKGDTQKKERHITKERVKHSLSKKDKEEIIRKQKHYLEYGIDRKYIENFFLQCEAKNYKYADFGKALLVWFKKDNPEWEKRKPKYKPPDPNCPKCKDHPGIMYTKDGKETMVCDCTVIKRGK